MSLGQLTVIAALGAGASFSQSLSGFGFSLLIIPPLTFVVGPKEAVVTATLMGMITSALTIAAMRESVVWKLAGFLFLASAVGMPVGLLVLIAVDAEALRLLIAVTVLLAAFLTWRGYRLSASRTSADAIAGFLSGVLSTSIGMSGPPLVLHFQNRGIRPASFRATLNALFLAGGVLASFLFALSGRIGEHEMVAMLAAAPLIWLGWLAGHHSFGHLNAARFQQVTLMVLVLSATSAIAGMVSR